jgi:site-specific recombinase XerD
MSALYERMIQDMQLRGFSPRTQEAYGRAVRQLADHYAKSPDRVTEEELRQYFLHRTNVSRWSRVACTIALCGIKFFYEQTLRRDWTTVGLAKPKRRSKFQGPSRAGPVQPRLAGGPTGPLRSLIR